MPLDPQVQALVERLGNFARWEFSSLEPAAVRRLYEGQAFGGGRAVARVEDRAVPGPAGEIPVRVYTPEGSPPWPGLVYFHGGGFVLCNLETHDATCRLLANAIGCVVVSVDYRLAPEHKFPAAPEDCYAATRWVAKCAAELGIDPSRIAVAGDSAGGNLAAVAALMARDRGGPALRQQLLIYPMLDPALDTPSHREYAEGYLINRKVAAWFWRHYLADPEQGTRPYASPLRAPDLGGLPPALVITAELDPLRDEGEAYAQRLREAGVEAKATRYDGMIHGFFSFGDLIDGAKRAAAEVSGVLRAALAA